MECFTVKIEDIEGRIDSNFYKEEYRFDFNKKFEVVYLRELTEVVTKGETPLWRGDFYHENGIPFLKVNNISIEGVKGNLTYINEETHNKMKRSKLKGGELLYTMAGTIGIATILPENFGEANINQAIAKIILKKEINKFYIRDFLNSEMGFNQSLRSLTTSAQPNINFEQIKNIKIPLPPIDVQNEIVEIMDKAYQQKKEKEQQAEELLNSINTYVLKELGIEIPQIEEKKTFKINVEEVKNNRTDVFYNQPKFKEIEKNLLNSNNEIKTLGEITKLVKTGTTPSQSSNPFVDEKEIIFLRNTNLKKYFLDLSDVKYIRKDLEKGLIYSRKNDLLICIAGTIGTSAVNTCEEKIAINQNISALKLKDNVKPEFMSIILNLSIYEDAFKRVASLATIYYINNVNLLTIKVPVPSLEIQDKIILEVQNKILKSNELKKSAKEELEETKKKVEEILLN